MRETAAAVAEDAATTEAVAAAEDAAGPLPGEGGAVVQLSIFGDEEPPVPAKPAVQAPENPGLRAILNLLKDADLMNMTPLQAMQLVNDLKMKAKDL